MEGATPAAAAGAVLHVRPCPLYTMFAGMAVSGCLALAAPAPAQLGLAAGERLALGAALVGACMYLNTAKLHMWRAGGELGFGLYAMLGINSVAHQHSQASMLAQRPCGSFLQAAQSLGGWCPSW